MCSLLLKQTGVGRRAIAGFGLSAGYGMVYLATHLETIPPAC